MIWGLSALVALVGLILGFGFRAPILIALTLAIIVGCFLYVWLSDAGAGTVFTWGLVLLVSEHIGYFAGLALSTAVHRRSTRS